MRNRHLSDVSRKREATLSRRDVLQAGAGAAAFTAVHGGPDGAMAQPTPAVALRPSRLTPP